MPSALTWRARKNRRKRGKEIDLRRWSQYQDPPRRLRLGPGDSPCRVWMVILRASRGTQRRNRSLASRFPHQASSGGGMGSLATDSRPEAWTGRDAEATPRQSWTRDLDFERDERKCPQQCWCQRQCSWVESNYLGPGPSLARCGGRNRIWGVITISIPTGRTGHAERNSCAT